MRDLLEARKRKGNYRTLSVKSALIDFSSNDYLGISRSKSVLNSLKDGLASNRINSIGATGSRLLTGNTLMAEKLESKIAHFHGFAAGLLFNCGYMANLGLLSGLDAKNSLIIYDSQVHASMKNGISLSRIEALPFRHNDCAHLEVRLRNHPLKQKYICIESMYSTDGTLAQIEEIIHLANQHKAHLIVDEAHAVGVLGVDGVGLITKEQAPKLFAKIVTFGKALGHQGAIILCNKVLKDYLINFCHPFIYTTAMSLISLYVIDRVYDLFYKMSDERKHIQKLVSALNFGNSHIQSFPIPTCIEAKKAAVYLAKQGFDIRALTSPTVRQGHEILRICLHAYNSLEEVQHLKAVIGNMHE